MKRELNERAGGSEREPRQSKMSETGNETEEVGEGDENIKYNNSNNNNKSSSTIL